jgi:hypothetical protein
MVELYRLRPKTDATRMAAFSEMALGREVVSLDRKCRGAEMPGRSGSADRRTFSIRRLEGRRWWLRRARPMEIESLFGADSPERRVQLSPRTTGKSAVGSWTGSENDGWIVRKRLCGAGESTQLSRRALSTSVRRNWVAVSRRVEKRAWGRKLLRGDPPKNNH